ncbi:PREDICTED: valacyclovir hydrolase-like [Rhagoletis zephyria]|uniref:valacyclovir hydrolase-like n=1 Tax=Rhagoletis zephyria TaxID=28612 RepID=UPI0008112DA8|nr:PREDICTED: valacyclovir hydrolase-like [Rhagoletis zephyria]
MEAALRDTGSVEVNGFPIHYNRYGTGSTVVLLIPGALGTAVTDFRQQLEGADAFNLKRYTFVVIELAGWGRSRPPKRPYGLSVYDNDVTCAAKLMEHLNYRNYSVIGWSDGAKVAILLGIFQPSRVNAIVASGIFTFCTQTNILPTIKTQNVDHWDIGLRANYVAVYGEESLQSLWDDHINFCKDLHAKVLAHVENLKPEERTKDVRVAIHEQLYHGQGKIRCPVLIVHGDKDPLIGLDQATYCKASIANCQLKRFPEASHNVHQSHAKEFRDAVVKFLDESSDFF